MIIHKIFGPPGTGKTTSLMKIVERENEECVAFEKMGYLSFSKAAREVTLSRMKMAEKEIPWFRTIHGAASKYLGLSRAVIQNSDYRLFTEATGMKITPEDSLDQYTPDAPLDYNITLRALNFAKTTCRPIADVLREFPTHRNLVRERVDMFEKKWTDYKKQVGRFDFMDMLTKFDAEGGPLPINVGILDETQDMSELQWRCVHKMYAKADRVYMAGDDDQAIYPFIGGSEYGFLEHPSDSEEVLRQSWRVPVSIGNAADQIIRRVAHRKQKAVIWKQEAGAVTRLNLDAMTLPWRAYLDKYESIMVLARHRAGARAFSDDLQTVGVPHALNGEMMQAWKEAKLLHTYMQLKEGKTVTPHMAEELCKELGVDADKLRDLSRKTKVTREMVDIDFSNTWISNFAGNNRKKRKRYEALRKVVNQQGHEALVKSPKISIMTMHGAKGKEADLVVILTDCNNIVRQNIQSAAEMRLSYVSLTRAKKDAVVLMPRGDNYISHFLGG